ncbi:DUF695 domain-containing protein [Solimicrobium silvestre]|uniref:DUF695 domain-containing protein n=1 Tax=Solimicrobium silvestre TaxID=2099400 RepID=A0A2S9GSZ2_9BURK|nr:DUF695 domain-containing protein [Solimicrobium silvestre]PRC90825.1 Family of unknown function (DUF695) [Solimicrobium silvestre]
MNQENQSLENQWSRFECVANGESSVIGCMFPGEINVDKAAYPNHVFIGYGYGEEDSGRLPNAEEWAKIDSIERTISGDLKKHDLGLLLFTIANDGYYQWNIYSKFGDKTALTLIETFKNSSTVPKIDVFDYSSSFDSNWNAYEPIREIIRKALGKATG